METGRPTDSVPWHPEVIDPSEVTSASPTQLRDLRDLVSTIADTFQRLKLPRQQAYLRKNEQLRLWVGRECSPQHDGRLFVAYSELPHSIHSHRTIYRINEHANGTVTVDYEKSSASDNAALSLGSLIHGPEAFLDHAVQNAARQKSKEVAFRAAVPGLGNAGVSQDEMRALLEDIHLSWTLRQVELQAANS